MEEDKEFKILANYFLNPLKHVFTEKPLFAQQKLTLADFMWTGAFLYETGSVIGWIYREKQLEFEKLLGSRNIPGDFIKLIRSLAKKREVENTHNLSVEFLFYQTEAKKLGYIFDFYVLEEGSLFLEWLNNNDIEWDLAHRNMIMSFLEGIGFGFEYPVETKRLWKAFREEPFDKANFEAKQRGEPGNPEYPIKRWNDRVSELKDSMSDYIINYRGKYFDLLPV